MDRNYTINLLNSDLKSFLNQNPDEPIICTNNFCCFKDWVISGIILNNLDKCFYSICNESYCKVFKGSDKKYPSKPILNKPNEYTIDSAADELQKELNQNSDRTTICKGNYCCFNDTMTNDIILNNLDKCLYSVCSESYCKVFKGSNNQFESQRPLKLDITEPSTSESSQSKSNINKSSQSKSSLSKSNLGDSTISRKLILFFCFFLLSNLFL
ncbi:hypothetical protein K502DRAFT_345794 [Neoconidiobolus thromboides FSU 785]|nr:hypothetical protein K502DRAFT_345794 [Neoconidiobolus thromboides FSU 785]